MTSPEQTRGSAHCHKSKARPGFRRITLALLFVVFLSAAFVNLRAQLGGTATGIVRPGVSVLGEQPPVLSSGLATDILGIPTGNRAPLSIGPDLDINRSGPGIFIGLGQVVYEQTDLAIAGLDEVTTFAISRRHITRRNQENSIFGPAWAFNYDHTITRDANDNVLMNSFGRRDFFVKKTEIVWEGTQGRFDRLTYDTVANTYQLRMPHGTILLFNAEAATKAAHLAKVTSPNTNELTFNYEASGPLLKRRLLGIVDAFGRTSRFEYSNGSSYVTKIIDFSGREVVYTYDGQGRLTSVRSPVVTNTGGINNFPNGKTFRFTYSANTEPRLANALTGVVFPNQAEGSAGVPRLSWSYYEGAAANNPFFGYVKSFSLGNTNLPSGAVGGVYNYTYRTLAPGNNDLMNLAVREVSIWDRTGVPTKYKVNAFGHVLEEKIFSKGLRPDQPDYYAKTFSYGRDGEVTGQGTPTGIRTKIFYLDQRAAYSEEGQLVHRPSNLARSELPRSGEINMTAAVVTPNSNGGGDKINTKTVFEPVFNKPFKVVDERGFATT